MQPVYIQCNKLRARRLRVVHPTHKEGERLEANIYSQGVLLGKTTNGVLDFQRLMQDALAKEENFGEYSFHEDATFEFLTLGQILLMTLTDYQPGETDDNEAQKDRWNMIWPHKLSKLEAKILLRDRPIKIQSQPVIAWEYM